MYYNWDYLFDSYLAKSKEELFDTAKYHYDNLLKVLTSIDGKEEAEKEALAVLSHFLLADDETGQEELNLFNYILEKNISSELYKSTINSYAKKYDKKSMIELTHKLDDVSENYLVSLGLCIYAVDGNIADSERQFIDELVIR